MPIIDQYTALTKTQLVDLLAEGQSESVPDPIVYRPDGQPERMGSTVKDARGIVTGYQAVEFTYYDDHPERPVDVITVTEKDAAAKVVGGHRVKHGVNGERPVKLALDVALGESDVEGIIGR